MRLHSLPEFNSFPLEQVHVLKTAHARASAHPPPHPPLFPMPFAAPSCIIKVARRKCCPCGARLVRESPWKRSLQLAVCLFVFRIWLQGKEGRGSGLQHQQIKATCAGSLAWCLLLLLCCVAGAVDIWQLGNWLLSRVAVGVSVSAHWFNNVRVPQGERGRLLWQGLIPTAIKN